MINDSAPCQRSRTIERLMKKGGFKARISAKCCECAYDPYQEGSWRQQVQKCTSFSCPLYSVRPVSTGSVKEVE